MSARVTLTLGEAGAVAVKTATEPEQVTILAVEAERLRAASHPGVVHLVDYRVVGGRAELLTTYAGEALEHWRGTLDRAAGLVAALAATVADLHEIGLVHGRLDPSHVLLAADGRPRLCGLSLPDGDPTPADDVAALGELLDTMAERSERSDRPGLLGWTDRNRSERRAARLLVARATDPVPAHRPSARALAQLVMAAVPGAELPPPPSVQPPEPPAEPDEAQKAREAERPEEPEEPEEAEPSTARDDPADEVFGDQTRASFDDLFEDRPWTDTMELPTTAGRPSRDRSRRPRRRRSAARTASTAAVVAAGTLAIVMVLQSRLGAGSPRDIAEATQASAPLPGPPCPPVDQPLADVDGDGCSETIRVSGSVVEVSGERWAVGRPGDAITVGDWDCDGTATAAVYRPTTGDVFLFSGWAATGEPLTAAAVAQIPGGQALVSTPQASGDGQACDTPAVQFANGSTHAVAVGP